MADDAPPLTLQQRIAALNAAHLGRSPGDSPAPTRQKPQTLQQRPPLVERNSINIPYEKVNGSVTQTRVGNQPNGPPDLPARRQPPPLPARQGTANTDGQAVAIQPRARATAGSVAQEVDTLGVKTNGNNRVKAPAWGQGDLPVLSLKVKDSQQPATSERPSYTSRLSSNGEDQHPVRRASIPSTKQVLPPPLPTRKPSTSSQEQPPETSARKLSPIPSAAELEQAKRSAFSRTSPSTEQTVPGQQDTAAASLSKPRVPVIRPASTTGIAVKAPPIPHASRPDLTALQATKPKFVASGAISSQPPPYSNPNVCMICRDFSGPDDHAARFPRQQVTSLPDLARQLTAPFQSHTDQARAIFTWLHHNISYDVVSFFNDRVQGSTPQSTLQTGLAVCEGYAVLFTNLATHAGLESVVISGHGKGYGHTSLAPGDPIPPYKMGHAWNAVKIDHGEWKLIDPCWGAGHVQGKGMPYVPHFNPSMFTMPNEEFGIKHFPSNKSQLFLPAGRTMTWEEYIQINPDRWPYDCDPPTVFSNAKEDHSIEQRTVVPRDRRISVRTAAAVRFQFGLFCEHWTLERHTKKGSPPVFILATHGVDGRKDDFVPLEHVKGRTPGGGGDVWFLDIPARELGAAGQTLTLFAITTFGDRQNARGLTVREFLQGKGKVGMAFSGIAAWDLI